METLADLASEPKPDPAKVKADVAGFLERRGVSHVEAERIVQVALDQHAALPEMYQDVGMLYSIAEQLRRASQLEAK